MWSSGGPSWLRVRPSFLHPQSRFDRPARRSVGPVEDRVQTDRRLRASRSENSRRHFSFSLLVFGGHEALRRGDPPPSTKGALSKKDSSCGTTSTETRGLLVFHPRSFEALAFVADVGPVFGGNRHLVSFLSSSTRDPA